MSPRRSPSSAQKSSASICGDQRCSCEEFYEIDLSDPASIDQAVAVIGGRVDALFNVAGVSSGIGDPLRVVTINFLGTRHFTESLIPPMPPGSAIANVSSLAASAYRENAAVTAGLLDTATMAEGIEWCRAQSAAGRRRRRLPAGQGGDHSLRDGQRRQCWAPRAFGSTAPRRVSPTHPSSTSCAPRTDRSSSTRSPRRSAVPRSPDEQASVLVFLNSPAARYITGQVIWVDGGAVAERVFGDISEPSERWNMASLSDFRRVADDVRNWGRWGDADELGTLNLITAEKVATGREPCQARQGLSVGRGLRLVGTAGRVPLPAEPAARHDDRRRRRRALCSSTARNGRRTLRRPAQRVLRRTARCASTTTSSSCRCRRPPSGTRLSHVYYEDKLYNGFPADSVTSLGAFHCGIDKVDGKGITSRGVLLDIVRLRGVRDLLRTRRSDHACRTRRSGTRAGCHRRAWRHRAGPDRLVGKVSADRRRH